MSARAQRAWYAGLTDQGRSRSHNEDAFVAQPPLFVVADGLGGHKAGEVASEIAADVLAARAPSAADAQALAAAVRAANQEIMDAVTDGLGRSGMGTTVTAAVVHGTRIVVAQVGDSRAYLLRGDRLTQLTRDHSLVGEMVRSGTLSAEEARFHPSRSVITRALGSRPEVEVDTYEVSAEPGDRLLLCSDGLHGMIEDPEIEALLRSAPDAQDAARSLVDAANDAGGLDNITAVVVEIEAPGGRAPRIDGRRRVAAAVLWLAAALFVIAAAAFGVRTYAEGRAYVVAEDGVIVVYRGLPGDFAGIGLSWQEQVTDVRVDTLPELTAARLADGVAVESVPAAIDLVAEYRSQAATSAPDPAPTTEP